MCGRFTLASPAETLAGTFGSFEGSDDAEEVPELAPRYNIAPTEPVAVIRDVRAGEAPRRRLEQRRWGLVPHFAEKIQGPPLFNARAETLGRKPAFRDAFRRKRCLVPADGFYEWMAVSGRRQPFYFRREDGGPFAMAGLWDRWQPPEGPPLESCTIVTTRANALLAPVHERMPVVLPEEAWPVWLDPEPRPPEDFTPWLAPAPTEGWTSYPVDTAVNRSAHDEPSNVRPLFDDPGQEGPSA